MIVQFIGQAVGVMLLRKRWGSERLPFKMWLYPLPAVLTMLGWAWLFWQTGKARIYGLMEIALGVTAYLVWAYVKGFWPFVEPGASNSDATKNDNAKPDVTNIVEEGA